MAKQSAIVIGAGIVGLAISRALATRGYTVTVLERGLRATGASIRNFGMIWPIGQPSGHMYERALRSRSIWKQVCNEAGIWCEEAGSLHLAYNSHERNVLEELFENFRQERPVKLLDQVATKQLSGAVVPENLEASLYSADELIVDPRHAIPALALWLAEKGVRFLWGRSVLQIAEHKVYTAEGEELYADLIFVCSGADLETLYPDIFARLPITKCKLQMMRLAAQPAGWRIGPALCGGLSLVHYKSFTVAPSLAVLKEYYENEMTEFLRWGIHVMVAQNGRGELTIGDSHEYGQVHDPFDKSFINEMILQYLSGFAHFRNPRLLESWNGIYAKLTDGATEFFWSPENGTYIVNALGGAGMTLSFGLAEHIMSSI